jgi:ribosome-binding factor A
MESQRQKKFASLLLRDLSEMMQRQFKSLFGNAFVTITHVKVSPDLGVASVYISFLGAKNEQELLDNVLEANKQIRQELGQKIRHQVRVIPELRFFLDDTAVQAAKIDALFASIDIPKLEE